MQMSVDFDPREFIRAMAAAESELTFTNYSTLTRNSRLFLGNLVTGLPQRSGNLLSAAVPSWRELQIAGSPRTSLAPGVKTVTVIDRRGREKQLKLKSAGSFEDQRRRPDNALFKFKLQAWERRVDPKTGRKKWRPYGWFAMRGRNTIREAANVKFDFDAFKKLLKKYSA